MSNRNYFFIKNNFWFLLVWSSHNKKVSNLCSNSEVFSYFLPLYQFHFLRIFSIYPWSNFNYFQHEAILLAFIWDRQLSSYFQNYSKQGFWSSYPSFLDLLTKNSSFLIKKDIFFYRFLYLKMKYFWKYWKFEILKIWKMRF